MSTNHPSSPSALPSGSVSSYRSPVLSHPEISPQPPLSLACRDCPKSMWYQTEQALTCLCRATQRLTWPTPTETMVLMCDERELSLRDLSASL